MSQQFLSIDQVWRLNLQFTWERVWAEVPTSQRSDDTRGRQPFSEDKWRPSKLKVSIYPKTIVVKFIIIVVHKLKMQNK